MEKKTNRIFIAGSEWLYYKIYAGPQISDYLLITVLKPIIDDLFEKDIIDKWFFIRYADPETHLRIRFHLKNTKYVSFIIEELYMALKPCIISKMIFNIEIGAYKRELERYGQDIIEEIESLFLFNSNLITKIIELNLENLKDRWLIGLKAIDIFLDQWGFNLLSKKILLQELKEDFGIEFGVNKNLRKQLSYKFRNDRSRIESILINDTNVEIKELFKEFSELNPICINKILQKRKKSNYEFDVNDLIKSLIHMHCNRLFKSNQRLNEWVLYDFMFLHYQSTLARRKLELRK